MTISKFDIICFLVSLVSVIITIIQGIKHTSFEKSILNTLKSLLDNVDYLCIESDDGKTKREILVLAKAIRSQIIALIEMTPGRKERLPTFDYGIKGKTITERAHNRKKHMGIDIDGCIIRGQNIAIPENKTIPIENCMPGQIVLAYDFETSSIKSAILTRIQKYNIKNYILINKKLCLSGEHKVYVKDKGWLSCCDLSIGETIIKIDDKYERVDSIVFINQKEECYSVHISPYECLYANGYLVHNEEEDGK